MEPSWKKVPLREGTTRLTAIDAHTAGGPLRLITGGLPELSGSTILERPTRSATSCMGSQGYAHRNFATTLVIPACTLRCKNLVPTRVVA
jgi:hypothetical protein